MSAASRGKRKRKDQRDVLLYHGTTYESAQAIVVEGFRDPDPNHIRTRFAHEEGKPDGVWFLNVPPSTEANYAQGEALLEVVFPAEVNQFRMKDWDFPGEAEYRMPAEWANRYGRLRLLSVEEADEVRERALR